MSKTTLKTRRSAAFERQHGRCYYCGAPMWNENPADFAARHGLTRGAAERLRCTAEHLLPRQDGGPDSADNIVAACAYCNHTRHRTPRVLAPGDYRQRIQRRLRQRRWHPPKIRQLMPAPGASRPSS